MIKRLIILLVGLNSFAYAQNEVHFVYVDNYKSIKNNELLKQELDKVAHKTNIQFLLFYSRDRQPIFISDLLQYETEIDDVLLNQISRPSQKDDLRRFSKIINDDFSSFLSIGEGVKKGELHFHFFFDVENCKRYRYNKKFVNKLLLIYNLTNRNGLNNNCFVHYHINYEDSQSDLMYDSYLKELESRNITINTYPKTKLK